MTKEEAKKKIKEAMPTLWKETKEALQTLIPELAESGDERIRKELIEFIQWSVDRHFMREDFHQAKRPSEWIAYLEKQKEQKQEWSEEDEENINSICSYLDSYCRYHEKDGYGVEECKIRKDWLKSLPERFNLQPKEEWSEEDEKRIKQLIYDTEAIRAGYEKKMEQLGECFNKTLIKDCDEQIAWLKSLRPQSKRKWTLSDEKLLGDVMVAVELDKFFNDEYQKKIVSWLRSLRPYPQSHWKPSEEQMKWLKDVIETVPMTCRQQIPLESLYNDLKKLM